MKYVESIDHEWGSALGFTRYPVGVAIDGRVTVRDEASGDTEIVELVHLWRDNYLGSGITLKRGGVVAKHTPKLVQLYHHVISAGTRVCIPVFENHGEDIVMVCEEGMFGFKDNGGAGKAIAVNTTNEYIEVAGLCGSVAIRSEEIDDTPQVLTLYGLLGKFCRWSRVNLLTYEKIRFYSPGRRYETIIELSQTPEAKRYFTKMFLDVMSGRGLDPAYG